MKTYQERKEIARHAAIDWQADASNKSYSYGELAQFSDYFTRLAKRFGLVSEFRENGII